MTRYRSNTFSKGDDYMAAYLPQVATLECLEAGETLSPSRILHPQL